MKTFSISIPKPCHEDWNKMTPDAKGAFCASCKKSVYDFSKKTDDEIIEVFETKGKEKVCGRFAPSQLSRPVVSFGTPTNTSMLAKFAYALLLVFGATLFSGEAFGQDRMVKGESEVRMMGKPSLERLTTEEEVEIADTVAPLEQQKPITRGNMTCGVRVVKGVDPTSLGQPVVIEESIMRMGDTMLITEPEETENVAVENYEMITGEMVAFEQPMGLMVIETIDTVVTITEPIEIIEPVENIQLLSVMGNVSYVTLIETAELTSIVDEENTVVNPEIVHQPEEFIQEEIAEPVNEEDEENAVVAAENIIVPPTELQVKISPNPSRGEITLSYTLESNSAVKIELYDVTGKKVKALTELGRQYAGKYNVSYNISDLPNGIYMATLSTDENKISAKVILTK